MPVFHSSARSFKRAFVSSVAVAGALLALPALPAHAEAEALVAVNGAFTGTTGNDTLIIGNDGTNLTNNGFALGAPGFESAYDFDSTVAGVQTWRVPIQIDYQLRLPVSLGEGDDTLRFTNSWGYLAPPVKNVDLGPGKDTVDGSSATSGVDVSNSFKLQTIEVVIGSSYDDHIDALNTMDAARTAPLTVSGKGGNDFIAGTNFNDVIFGGGGNDRIDGRGGNDVMVAASPLPLEPTDLEGGAGNDQLVVQGTAGDDNLEIAGYAGNFYAFSLDNFERAYHAVNVERARLDLGNGDDFAFLSETLATTGVIGGNGTDQVIVDSFKSTATVSTVDSLKRLSIPLADRTLTVNLSGVEQYAPANETVIGTAPTPGGGPHVRTFRADGTAVANFYAYDANFTGGVTLGLGDLNGDADDEIITAAGPGGGPHVRVFYSDGTDTGVSFYAYDPSFNGGVSVAAIDLNGDGFDEIVTAPAKNAPPVVRIFDMNGELIGEWAASGFGTSGLTVARGARVGSYGGDQILLSAADGEQSTVRAFEADGTPAPQLDPYTPYGAFAGGASVSRGEFKGINGNADVLSNDEIITGAGRGGGPVVRVVQRAATGKTLNTIGTFFAYSSSYTGGIEVAACNPDGGNDEIVTVPAHGGQPAVRMFNLDGSVKRKTFLAYDAAFTNGIHVTCGGAISRFFGMTSQEAKPVAAQSVAPHFVSFAAKLAS